MFKKLMFMRPYQLFIAILLPFLFCILLVILLQSTYMYNNFEKVALQMIYNGQKTNLQNLSHDVSVMDETISTLSTQAFFDNTIGDILYSDVEPWDYMKHINKLISYKNIYPFLDSIYVYNGRNIYATPSYYFSYDIASFYDRDIIRILQDMKSHKTHSMIPRRIPDTQYGSAPAEPGKFQYVYTYLLYDSQLQSGEISEALILNVSPDWIWKDYAIQNDKKDTRVFIIDEKGSLISKDDQYAVLDDLSSKEYVRNVMESKSPVGHFRMNVDGTDSFITYVAAGVFDWKLISITPYRQIVQDIYQMRMSTYRFVLLLLAGSILIFVYLSGRLYIPMKALIQNVKLLQSEKRRGFYGRKQDFLRKMVNNPDEHQLDTYWKQFAGFSILFEPTDSYMLILLKIDSFAGFCSKFNREDQELMRFSILNILSELVSEAFRHECIDMREDQMLVLAAYPQGAPPMENEPMKTLIGGIQDNVEKYLGISLSFTVSKTFGSLDFLHRVYEETLDLSYNRLALGHRSIQFQNQVQTPSPNFKYPLEKVKQLTDALALEHTGDAKNVFLDIMEYASGYGFTILHSTLMRVLVSIQNTIDLINSTNQCQIKYNFNIYFSSLQKFETLDEIKPAFFQLFESMSLEMEQAKDCKYSNLIEQVIHRVYEAYPDANLSLESIAEAVNFSPAYLGRLFKKHKSISIAEFINQVRLEKAKEFLTSSEEAIQIVMEQTGFISPSHFYTLFKKAYGITPSQYRANFKAGRE